MPKFFAVFAVAVLSASGVSGKSLTAVDINMPEDQTTKSFLEEKESASTMQLMSKVGCAPCTC